MEICQILQNTFMDQFWLDPWPWSWLILKLFNSDSELIIFDNLHKTYVKPIDCPASSSSFKSTFPSYWFLVFLLFCAESWHSCKLCLSSQRKISEFGTQFSGVLPILHLACLPLHRWGISAYPSRQNQVYLWLPDILPTSIAYGPFSPNMNSWSPKLYTLGWPLNLSLSSPCVQWGLWSCRIFFPRCCSQRPPPFIPAAITWGRLHYHCLF